MMTPSMTVKSLPLIDIQTAAEVDLLTVARTTYQSLVYY